MTDKPKLVVITGPTATGKSDLAVALALKFNGEIISADSRQVYKDLNIGTGKITKKDMLGVPHHLLDVASPKKIFTVSDFKNLAEKVIEKITAKGKLPIICGGTGFYIDALLGDKQIPRVPPNKKLRKNLETKNTEELFEILKRLDKDRSVSIDRYNPRRLVRAIEIAKAIGKTPPYSVIFSQEKKYDVLKIGINIADEDLKKRINTRLEKRIKQGMIAEAKQLHEQGLSYKRMRELGLEYRSLADFLAKKISKTEMVNRLQKEIWHYAKRQRIWFKKDKKIVWLPPNIILVEKETIKFIK